VYPVGSYCTLDYICIRKGPWSKSKPQGDGTWSGTPWSPSRCCYYPAVFFHHLNLNTLSLPQGNVDAKFNKV